MNKGVIKNIALILLLVIAVFSAASYVNELKLRFSLQNSLLQAQGEVAQLSQEKQNLLQELRKEKELKGQLALKNRTLRSYVRAAKNRISRLFRENEHTSARLSILKAENRLLIDNRKRIYLENEQLKAGKRRIPALRKEGNRGYLLKEGKSTMKTRIEVIPVP